VPLDRADRRSRSRLTHAGTIDPLLRVVRLHRISHGSATLMVTRTEGASYEYQ